MAYGDFTLETVATTFGLSFSDDADLFADAPPVGPSDWLKTTLSASHLGRAMNTEKARSELMIAPFFTELWLRYRDRCSFFSGIEFNVDPAQGLRGYCDFIVSRSPDIRLLRAPVVMVTGAKNDNLPSGYGQCIAGMVAARLFNERRNQPTPAQYGAVSTGDLWEFLKLEGSTVTFDVPTYGLVEAGKILGILVKLIS